MSAIMARAQAVARSAQRRRLEEIAAVIGERGIAAKIEGDSVACRGRGLFQRWLGDSALRFAGRIR